MQEIPAYYYALLAVVSIVTFLTNFIFNYLKSKKDKKQEILTKRQLEDQRKHRNEELINQAIRMTTDRLNGRLVKNEEDIKHLNYRLEEQKEDFCKFEKTISQTLSDFQANIYKKLDELVKKVYSK